VERSLTPYDSHLIGFEKGVFISFEGIEGTGKTIQSKLLYEHFKKTGYTIILTEEPGGTSIGLKIRDVLLSVENKEITPVTELLLYNASRAQHLKEVILPALKKGGIVITDRFSDSTVAYQGYGRGMDLNLIDSLERIVTEGLKPDITLLLDLDVEIGLLRNKGINKTDRFELEDLEFHKKVRDGYLRVAAKEPGRIKLIDASGSIEEIQGKIINIVTSWIKSHRKV
jgi:dTMP kinase